MLVVNATRFGVNFHSSDGLNCVSDKLNTLGITVTFPPPTTIVGINKVVVWANVSGVKPKPIEGDC